MQYQTKDSGKRQHFNTGAVRDTPEGKGRYDLLPCHAIKRVAQVFERGAQKYDARNWEKGIPVCRFLDSALRHAFQALDGQTDEDHLGQAAWNILCAIDTQERCRDGRLPPVLDDIPQRPAVADTVAADEGRLGNTPVDAGAVRPERVYIAGPYSGPDPRAVESNVVRAVNAAEEVAAKGHDVHCPHAATHEIAKLGSWIGRPLPYERWMRLDLGIIERWATALLYLAPSPGADRELALAKKLGLKIYTSIDQVPDIT